MALVWTVDLAAGEKLVLLALADCANDDGHCWPGIRNLCAKTGKSERSLQASIKALETAGHITRDEVKGKGCNYLVHPRKICTPAKSAPPQKMQRPPQNLRDTPAKSAGKPSLNHKEPSTPKIAHEIPDDWQPLPLTLGTQAHKVVAGWPPGELEAQAEAFQAHHLKNGSKFKDWQQAWITWVLNTRKFGIGKHERTDPTFGALAEFNRLISGNVGTGSGTG